MTRGEARDLPRELRDARRALDTVVGYELIRDLTWHVPTGQWVVHIRLTPGLKPRAHIPASTEWYVLIDAAYPRGAIEVHPARVGSISVTFPHQSLNAAGSEDVPWREGKLCLDTSVHALGRNGLEDEPFDVSTRLRWRVERACAWLRAAASGELVRPGEPFELPAYESRRRGTVAFSEGLDTYALWERSAVQSGGVVLRRLRRSPDVVVAEKFRATSGTEIVTPSWGDGVRALGGDVLEGVFVRLAGTPRLDPWQAPRTWGEFRRAVEALGHSWVGLMKPVVQRLRDARSHYMLVGFPIPAVVGAAPVQMHWLALRLPPVTTLSERTPGFRLSEEGRWHRDQFVAFGRDRPVDWVASENWHPDEVAARGRLDGALRHQKITLLGAGALGAVVAELLVRAGAKLLVVVDGQELEAGNLVRHPLTLADLAKNKAAALAERLQRASVHASIRYVAAAYPDAREAVVAVEDADLVIDCTGDDVVLHGLAGRERARDGVFMSLSMGLDAKRLFCFTARGRCFPHEAFFTRMQPWLRRERAENRDRTLLRAGLGCWHPLFPARADDVWIMAGAAVRWIEEQVGLDDANARLTVFEQTVSAGRFSGIQRHDDGTSSARPAFRLQQRRVRAEPRARARRGNTAVVYRGR